MTDKFNFNLKTAAIYQAVKWSQTPFFKLLKPLRKLFSILFVLIFLIFIYGFLTDDLSMNTQSLMLGLSIIFLTWFLGLRIKESFLNSKLKNPKLSATVDEVASNLGNFNLADFLSFEVAGAVADAISFSKKKKLPEISSTLLFYFLLSKNQNLNFIFSRALLRAKEIKMVLENYLETIGPASQPLKMTYSEDFQESILEALRVAQKKDHLRIEIGDVISGLAKHDMIFKRILIDNNLKAQDIENLTWWLEDVEEKIRESKRFWEWKNLIKKGSLGKQWTAGYTPILDQFSIDLSETMRKRGFPEVIGHKKEIAAAERILSRREINNVLVVGESGSGRKSIIQALAKKSFLGESLPEVNYKRVVQLDLSSLLAQITTGEEIESFLDNIFKEVIFSGNVILVIDEFHNFIGGGGGAGAHDTSLATPRCSW